MVLSSLQLNKESRKWLAIVRHVNQSVRSKMKLMNASQFVTYFQKQVKHKL
jgi:hypothetical protein